MTENIIVRFSVPSLKSTVKLISKDELGDCCLKSWLGDKTNQMQQGVPWQHCATKIRRQSKASAPQQTANEANAIRSHDTQVTLATTRRSLTP